MTSIKLTNLFERDIFNANLGGENENIYYRDDYA